MGEVIAGFLERQWHLLDQALSDGVLALCGRGEDDLSIGEFYTWMRLLHEVAALSNLSEKLANRVRMLLTLK